jgi:hypothetical protein
MHLNPSPSQSQHLPIIYNMKNKIFIKLSRTLNWVKPLEK